MQLLTKALLARFAKVGSQEHIADPKVIAHFFNPTGAGNWLATEYNPTERTFFGYVSLFGDYNDELGYFSLDELAQYRGKFGLGIERDLHFDEVPLSEIKAQYTK